MTSTAQAATKNGTYVVRHSVVVEQMSVIKQLAHACGNVALFSTAVAAPAAAVSGVIALRVAREFPLATLMALLACYGSFGSKSHYAYCHDCNKYQHAPKQYKMVLA